MAGAVTREIGVAVLAVAVSGSLAAPRLVPFERCKAFVSCCVPLAVALPITDVNKGRDVPMRAIAEPHTANH